MKKAKAILLVGIMGIGLLAGCGADNAGDAGKSSTADGGAGNQTKGYTIGVCSPNLDDKFQVYLSDEIKATAEKMGAKTILVDAKEDTAKQLGQVENFIVQGVDAIICIPVDTDAAEPIVSAAKQAEIPFVCVNREIKSDDVTAYVGSSDITAGELQAEILMELVGEKANVGIIEGIPGHIAGIGRVEGFKKKTEGKTGIVVESMLPANFQRSEGVDVMENWLKAGMGIDTIIACNDEMAIGASIAIEQAGKTGEYTIIGIDGTPEGLQTIKEGKMQGTCFQNPFAQGSTAVEVAMKAIQGESFEQKNYIPFEKVTSENVDKYIEIWKSAK